METEITKDNLLPLVKSFNLMETLPKILNVDQENFKITPSEFIKEISLTTEERYKKLVHASNLMKNSDDNYPPQFKVIPHILVFQGFEARGTYTLTLQIRNIGRNLLQLKMHCPRSIYFSAKSVELQTTKLASGLSIDYEITFTPKEARDYFHELIFNSKGDTFQVPIIAIGSRPLLDIPDHIVLEPTPVKIGTTKSIIVRNIGKLPAVFNFINQRLFRITPSKGILGVHESMILNINFVSPKAGEVTEYIYLVFETGEKLTVTLHGSAENVTVRLDKNSIVHDDTFLGLKRCKTVRLFNNSSHIVKFVWKRYKTEQEDLSILENLRGKREELHQVEILKDTIPVYYGLSTSDTHKLSSQRLLKDDLQLLEKEEFNFSHEAFSIIPMSGEIWPKNFIDMIISFEPKVCGFTSTEAYLDVLGRDSRLPLRIKGNGAGPQIILNVQTLDTDFIYLCSVHNYEVIASNKSDIPGWIEYETKDLVFGGKVEVTPRSRHLNPGECGVFVISFTSNRSGEFTEKLLFKIKESGERLTLVLKGKIISPILHFDTRLVDFGTIPIGFPTVREVTLSNLSVVPVTFSIRILSDGENPSLTFKQFAEFSIKPNLPHSPKEFEIDPEEGVVEPFSHKKVTVAGFPLTLTANRSGRFESYLVVDLWDSESGSVGCPVSFNSKIANIIAKPELISVPFCFLNFPYTRTITLRNLSKVAGFFYLVPMNSDPESPITCSVNTPQGVLEPKGFINIDITFITNTVGRHSLPIQLLVFGNNEPSEVCILSCMGQGPVVTVTPNSLSWPDLPLLQVSQKKLVLANESPIPATLNMYLIKTNSQWSINFSSHTLLPEETIELEVSVTLTDRGKYKDVLRIDVHNGKEIKVCLSAVGVGSCLKITPNMSPRYDLEILFSNTVYQFEVTVENKGSKSCGLIWSPFPDYKTFLNFKLTNRNDFVFKFEPSKIDIQPGDTKKVTLEVQSAWMGLFNQTFYCFVNIGGPHKEFLMTCDICAEFVEPLVEIDKTEMKFWYNVGCEGIEKKLEDEVEITNLSVLPISIVASVKRPFCFTMENDESVSGFETDLNGQEIKKIKIKFMAEENENKYSLKFTDNLTITFKQHSKKCLVELIGEVNYPNVLILPTNILFENVPMNTNDYKEISLVNTSPLDVYYEIVWNSNNSTFSSPEKANLFLEKTTGYNCDEDVAEADEETEVDVIMDSQNEEYGEGIDEALDIPQNMAPPVKPVAKMPDIVISKDDVKGVLFPLTMNHHVFEDELLEAFALARSSNLGNTPSSTALDYSKVCDITPFYGKLEKFSSQILTVRLFSSGPLSLHLEAHLKIKSGPTEIISIKANIDEICFELNKTEFDFGKQLFCETKCETLKIHNTGPVSFSYEAYTMKDLSCDLIDEVLMNEVITIAPPSGTVKSFGEAELFIRYHPGLPGSFENNIQLQIAHLDPITIRIKGFGVFPQVSFNLPRPDISDTTPELGYLAVAGITPDWCFNNSNSPTRKEDMFSVKPYRSNESEFITSIKRFEWDLFLDGWELIEDTEFYPSDIDIQLAIERVLAHSQVLDGLSKSPIFGVYARTIPNFCVPAYEMDFGVAVIGRVLEYNVKVMNYGPLPAVMYGVSNPQIKEYEIHVRLKNRNEIQVGDCIPFVVYFVPKKTKFKNRFEKIEVFFHFEVYHGPKIPIRVVASVTYPHVIASMCTLNYSDVQCGCCKVMNLKLKNPGVVTAYWSLVFVTKSRHLNQLYALGAQDGASMFHLNYNSGILNPNEYCTIQITFKPVLGGPFVAALGIHVVESLEEPKIMLFGEGLEPKLQVTDDFINFEPTLPYPNKLEKTFVVENVCPFPIEFYLPSFDEQIFEEDKIIRAVCTYYQTKDILLPVRKPGDGLPIELVNFYHMLLDDLNAKHKEQEKEKMEYYEENVSLSGDDNPIISSSQVTYVDKKRRKVKKAFSRSRTSMENSRHFSLTNESGKDVSTYSILEKKTVVEVEELLHEYIRNLLLTEPSYDPIQTALKSVLPPVQEEEYKEGTLIIFYGAPYTNFVQMACRSALITGLQVYSIDRIVLEEAVLGRCEAGLAVKELIEHAYWDHVEAKEDKIESEMGESMKSDSGNQINFDEELEEIQRKLNALVTLRENLIAAKAKGPATPIPKSEDSKKIEIGTSSYLKPMNLNAPIANVTEELVAEILKYRLSLEMIKGVIIEGLFSLFISSYTKALTKILKAAGNVKDILVVILLQTYLQYARHILDVQTEQENLKLQVRQEVLRILDEEPEYVFESLELTEQETEEIRSAFLSQRRESQIVFEKQKEFFYENEKLKRALKKGERLPSINTVKFDSSVDKVQKDKKDKDKKKDGVKNNKTGEVGGGKVESDSKSAKSRKDTLEVEFSVFDADFAEITALITCWDQRIGGPVVDGSSELKVKKGMTPRKMESNLVSKGNTGRGIFSWLIDVSRPESNVFVGVCHYLKSLLQSKITTESDSWPLQSTESMTFSVVTYPPYRIKDLISENFTLTPIEPVNGTEDSFEDSVDLVPPSSSTSANAKLNRSASQVSFKSKRKYSGVSKRRKIDSRASIDVKNSKSKRLSSTGAVETLIFKSRWILQPGETIKWRVRYCPTEVGETEQIYTFNVVNWENSKVIHCFGKCDIPSLDMTPEVVFESVKFTKPLASPYAPAYFCMYEAFDFGPIVFVQSGEKKERAEKTTLFTLKNKSSLPLELNIRTGQDVFGDNGFGLPLIKFEPDTAVLQPGESRDLWVSTNCVKLGPLSEILMFFVKDNPIIESIKVVYEVVKANLSVEPKLVNFDRILLHRKAVREVVVTNNQLIPFFITLVGCEDLAPEFSFSEVSGWIPPLQTFTSEIVYSATEAQVISEKPIVVQAFDDSSVGQPVQEISFCISVEAYDAALDIFFSDKDEDHIDFGDVRVETNCSKIFNLKNVGKYPLGFRIDVSRQLILESEGDQFVVSPQEGTLTPGKMFPLTVFFKTQNEVSWKRLTVFKILLVEPYKEDEMIAVIPIEVSVRSFFARYEIKPQPDFNFGHIRTCTLATGSLLIENKGCFSISYTIDNKSGIRGSEVNEEYKKSSKPSASSKEKTKKIPTGVLTLGPFEISPSFGIVEVGQTAAVSVSCFPSDVKTYEEKLIVFVNESLPHLKKGTELTLSATGCLPSIDFSDIKNIFREHFICKGENDFKLSAKTGSYTLFTEDNALFSFKNVCVCKTAEARIHLPNNGLIECNVTAFVTCGSSDEGSRTSFRKDVSNFEVSPSKLIIEPYSSGTLTITFRPEAIEIYKGLLTITLDMPNGYDYVVHVFRLLGNGILPQIEITEPNSKVSEGQVVVNFPPTSPGQYSTGSIAFSNVGLLDCKVVVELYNNQDGVFTMTPKESTECMLKMWELNKPIDHTVIVSMSAGQVAEFNLTFKPPELKSFSSEIKLFVVDNPFENLCYKLKGEVFFEEVMIEKIRTALTFMAGDSNDLKSTVHSSPGQYSLNFGDCYVKKKSKALIRLVNKTEKEYFKFEWEEIQNITVSPSIGHLYPNTYKEILVTFYPEEPIGLEEVPLICALNKILLENPPQPSWDSRLIQYQKQSKKEDFVLPLNSERGDSSPIMKTEVIKTSGDEPQFELVPESNNILLLNISATADYTRLYCETTRIILRNTFMFQTRMYPLVLENPGNVTLEYKLILKSLTAGPIKKNQQSQIREQSFLRLIRDQNRPQSSAPSYSDRSLRSSSKATKRLRPRPLTSASLLTLDKNLLESVLEMESAEEQKPITYNPFVLENSTGHIAAKDKATCKILFSPMDINEYNAIISIQVPNLHPDCSLPEIQVTASSIMPYCHFNIPESDYLENGRRDYSRPGPIGFAPGLPLDSDTKTIEIKVLGINLTVPIEFHVINPTEDDYTFSWINVTQIQGDVVPSFHCSTTDGRIQAGRQQLMVFSFVSQRLGITESFWKFCIPKFGVETLFLFVADVREPAVFCLSNHINLKPTFIGLSSSDVVKLINQEDTAFEFGFLPDSLYSEGRLNVLKVDPVAGKIPPNSEVSVRVTFTGKSGGKVLFNLKCKIKFVKEPISISVEATTYVVQPVIVFEDLKKIKHHVDSSIENVIDFGTELNPNCPETITLTFTSMSKTSFFYEWIHDKNALEANFCKIKFKPRNGHIPSLTRGKCDLTVVFSKKSSLMNYPVKLKISRGPTFNFTINASASTPSCEFSFNSYDFGYCFLQEKNICFYEVPLFIKNKDTNDVILECHLSESSPFSYMLSDAIIPSGAEALMYIYFHPKESIPYTDVLKFIINGLHEKMINLKGHGTEFKVTLTNANDTTISLGAVRMGKTSSRNFSLTNKSLAPAKVLVGFSDQFPVDGLYLARPKENLIDLSRDHRLSNIITIRPSTVFTIKPQETYTVNVLYTPQSKTSQFSETVSLQFQEKVEPICVLTGCCLGPEILLDRYILNFGAVLESCSCVLKLKLINSGSIGARFQWDIDQLKEYAISPASGYCSPGSDVTIEVTFRPTAVANCIKNKVECKLQLSPNESYPSLYLDLIGDCVDLPDAAQTVYFECVVRKMDTKILEIENMSGTEWQLVPVVSGEYFKGYEALVVPCLSAVEYEVNYCPLTMTGNEEFHEGSVFFRLPNGKGLLYKLLGAALPPDPEDIIVREVPAKTRYVELLKIRNWLQYPQRFKVSITCASNDNVEDPVWTCTGFENLELPTLAEKEYSLTFFAYKMGYLQFHIVFTNEETKEYMWYDITFNIISGGPLEVITLKSGVRQSCTYELKLENPLENAIQYQLESSSPDISFENSVQEVPPKQFKYVKLYYTPILAKEQTESLIAKCSELGNFIRELRLVGIEAQPEPPRTFETPLGTCQTQEISVQNMSKLNAVLRCKTDSEDFIVNGQTNASGGQVALINVTYEPSEMGTTSATLTVESDQAGNFVFPLLGFCVKPIAKGPFILRPGSGLTLNFKNVFKTSKEFHMSVDNPAFVLKTVQEIISPKEECKIYVGLQKVKYLEKMNDIREGGIEPRFPVMGQMIVECLNPYVKWQFYLKGVLDKGSS